MIFLDHDIAKKYTFFTFAFSHEVQGVALIVAELDRDQSDLISTESEYVWLVINLIVSNIIQALHNSISIIRLHVIQNSFHHIEFSFRFDKFGSVQFQKSISGQLLCLISLFRKSEIQFVVQKWLWVFEGVDCFESK